MVGGSCCTWSGSVGVQRLGSGCVLYRRMGSHWVVIVASSESPLRLGMEGLEQLVLSSRRTTQPP